MNLVPEATVAMNAMPVHPGIVVVMLRVKLTMKIASVMVFVMLCFMVPALVGPICVDVNSLSHFC